MMKLLILSQGGKTKEPEDVRYLNLYLASLRKHVMPYYDVKVILYNNALTNEATRQRVAEFGLDRVVEVRGLHDMELPDRAVEFMDKLSWFSKVGITMNMMYDYAKEKAFFDADWVFQTDTDIEFLPNFQPLLDSFQHIVPVHEAVILTVAGDTYPYNMRYKNQEWIFEPPDRLNLYTDEVLPMNFMIRKIKKYIRETHYSDKHELTFNLQQMKIRNDFVGFSRHAAETNRFNWVSCYYSEGFRAWSGQHPSTDGEELETLWQENQLNTTLPFKLVVNHDKGSLPQFEMQMGHTSAFKIQLRPYVDMAKHYSSGWMPDQPFIERSLETLKTCYTDTEHIWSKDYNAVEL